MKRTDEMEEQAAAVNEMHRQAAMDETMQLIARSQAGDKDAREQLVQENTGLVWSVVRRFVGRGHEPEDLFQIGSIGLLKCVDKFNVSFGVRFSTYAVPMIAGEVKRFLRDDGMIKVSRPLKELAVKAKYMRETMQHKTGRVPTIDELAAALETGTEDLVLAMEAGMEVESLHSVVHQGEGTPVLLIDKLEQSAAADSMIDLIALKEAILHLAPKERKVIFMRYFQDKTQAEIACAIGVSQVQVSRIEKRVLQSMRSELDA